MVLAASLTACSGEDATDPTGDSDASESRAPAVGAAGSESSAPTSGEASDARVVVDGKTYRFAFHDFTIDEGAAAMNGVAEVCDPSFMGAAFRAEGFLVDDSRSVVVENSILAGRIRLTLPTPGNEDDIPAEVSVLIVGDAVDGADGALDQKEMGVEIVDAEDGGHGFSARRGRRRRAARRRRS